MSRWLRHLNPEQQEAVLTIEGPLLVLAGAGSGKTRVITHRIAHMLDSGIEARSILAVTFTNKAAQEMRQRLVGMIGQAAADVTLSTFHALGLEILKQERGRRHGRRSFTVFDTGDQIALLRELLARLRFERRFDLGSILSRISAYKNAFIEPDQVHAEPDDAYGEAAAVLYPAYQELLEAYAAVDFDDLVCVPTLMMERDAACRERWCGRFRYLLVDEYQDTNSAQLRLLRALAAERRNLCVVGDDDQAIYGWRGADVRHILRFSEDFPGAKVVYLQRNYRSVGAVLDVANAVIAENPQRHAKRLVATREAGRKVRLVVARDGDVELSWVGRYLFKMLDEGRYRPSDVAVLYRSAILSRGVEEILREHGIRYRVVGGTAFYDRREVKDVIAYLRVCVNPNDEVSLRRVINSPPRGVGPKTVGRLAAHAQAHRRSLYWAVEQAKEALEAGDRAIAPLEQFAALLRQLRNRLKDAAQAPAATRHLLEAIQLQEHLQKGDGSPRAAARRWENVLSFVGSLSRYVERSPRPSLPEYLARLALVSGDDDAKRGPEDAVTLSTLHGAKGLEFPLVFLIGAEEGILPHDRTMNPHENDHVSGDISEERRLCYVGLTRAMDELIITWARQRVVHGRARERQRSRFIDAVPEALLEVEDLAEPPPVEEVRSMMADLRAMLVSQS